LIEVVDSGLSTPFPNLTGTMVFETNPSIADHIVLARLPRPPELTIRKYQALGAIAVVLQKYYGLK
jgi:hypothetical protein